MVQIKFDFVAEGDEQEQAFLDPYELNLMFSQTKQALEKDISRALEGVICTTHDQEPSVIVTGRYNRELEEMEISYHIDTCCKIFLLQVIQRLNHQV